VDVAIHFDVSSISTPYYRMSLTFEHYNATSDPLVGYTQSPNGRGTLTILFSCLLTLSLCVWSAVHLDLPRHGEGSTQYTWRYLKWSLLGVFGPELLIWIAWRQYISARCLTAAVEEVRDNYQSWQTTVIDRMIRSKEMRRPLRKNPSGPLSIAFILEWEASSST
jgi:hypothetical protein